MLIQYIPDSVLRDKYWMEQVPLLAERTEQAATGWSKERREKRKYGRKKSENNDLQPGETGCDQEQSVTPASATILTAAASTVASNHRHSSLLEPVRIAWREEEKESQTVNITNSPRQSRSRSQVHETRSRFCTIS